MQNKTTNPLELLDPVSPETLIPKIGMWPWFVLAALILIGVCVWLWVRFYKKKSSLLKDSVSARNEAYLCAKESLSKIRSDNPRDAAVQISLILRKYLFSFANDPALFETHEEFLARHDSLQSLDPTARMAAEHGFARLANLKYAPGISYATPNDLIEESKVLLDVLHNGFPT